MSMQYPSTAKACYHGTAVRIGAMQRQSLLVPVQPVTLSNDGSCIREHSLNADRSVSNASPSR
jgi:hypothetical protein